MTVDLNKERLIVWDPRRVKVGVGNVRGGPADGTAIFNVYVEIPDRVEPFIMTLSEDVANFLFGVITDYRRKKRKKRGS